MTSLQHNISRQNHLKRLLTNLFSLPELPQVDRWIASEFSKNKKFGSKDRKYYSEQIFLLVRNFYAILYQQDHFFNDLQKLSQEISTPQQLWDALKTISVEEYLEHLNSNFSTLDNITNKFCISSIPLWFESSLKKRFQTIEELNDFCNIQKTRPDLWIRLNHISQKNLLLKELHEKDIHIVESQFPDTFSVSTTKSLLNLTSFQNGIFEIQDYASQEIGRAVNAQPGEFIWDCCAGGGGKTIQLASALQNQGVIYASDIREYKILELKKRCKKAKFHNIHGFKWDAKNPYILPKEIREQSGFYKILVDAPCTGSGTWRRSPDLKYRTSIEDINTYSVLQGEILNSVKLSLKKNGRIIYATCSVFLEENEEVVQEFLEKNPNFKLIHMSLLGTKNSDLMFAAVMEKLS